MARHWRTFFLWTSLLGLFTAMYLLFSKQPNSGAAGTPAGADGGSSVWWDILTQWSPLFVLGVASLIFLAVQRRRHAAHAQGVRFLNQGRYLQALERFSEYRQREPQQAAAAFNTALARLHLWRLDEALADLQFASARPANRGTELAEWVPEYQALTLALLGRTGEATEQLRSIQAGDGDPGLVALTEAIVLVRGGDLSGARVRLGSFEVKRLGGPLGALARTLDAMCIEQLTGERRYVDRVALYGEASPEGLQRAWPELVAFVERAPAW